MSFMVSEEVTVKEGGPRMIVTGYSSGMVECRWYDGYGVKREAFHETELVPHYKIIAVLRYAIARLCQNHKKAGWESSGCSTRQKWKTRAG